MKRLFLLFLAMIPGLMGHAQLCTGSLGDPVVHINFGAGQNPGTPRNVATTNYTFFQSDCPNDGWYTIRNNTVNCFGNSWHSLSEDHTAGDGNGYFMLVNASFQPGDFYVDTVKDLCPKTTYEFAAWVVNVLKPTACQNNGIDPNLTFTIETTNGTILNTYNSGDIPESPIPVWKQYGLFFETPANTTTIVIRLKNNAPGGCGNDLALDDITFRPCGPAVTATIGVNGDTSASVCQGDTTSFLLTSAHSQGYSNPVFQWQVSSDGGTTWTDITGANQQTYLRKSTVPGDYVYRMSVAESGNIGAKSCRIASNNIAIHVNPLPVLQMSDVANVCLGSRVVLSASGGVSYQWTGPNGFTSTLDSITFPAIQNSDQGIYRLIATSDKGCSTNDSTDIRVNPVPTALVTGNDHICEGASTALDARGGTKYVWSPSLGLSSTNISNPSASPKDTTTYKVVVTNQFNCSDSANITIYVWKKPVANAGADLKTKEGIPVVLDGIVSGTDVEFFWSPPAFLDRADILKPKATLVEDIYYTLNVVSNLGCGVATDQVYIKVFKNVVIPNAFSPNNDGINDLWQIRGLSTYPDAEMQVFNRFGQSVYQTKSYNKPWDGMYKGAPLPVGTYYYVVDLKIGEPPLSGWVFIIR